MIEIEFSFTLDFCTLQQAACSCSFAARLLQQPACLLHLLAVLRGAWQVNFFDDSEVLLWPDGRWVTYKGKTRERATYDMADVLAVPDLAKRIKVRRLRPPRLAIPFS